MSTIANGEIELIDFGQLEPDNDNNKRFINLNDHIKGSLKESIKSLLSTIVEYNTKLVKDNKQQHRIGYYIRVNNQVFRPNYEYLSDDKNTLIVSVDGTLIREKLTLEMISVDSIIGIGSDIFTTNNFQESIDYNYGTDKILKENIEKIKEMKNKWLSTTNLNNKLTVELFMNDLKLIDNMNSYDSKYFYEEKNSYIANFLKYLEKIKNYGDKSLTEEDRKTLFNFYSKYRIKK